MNIVHGISQIKEIWEDKTDRKPFLQLTRDLGFWIIKNRGGVFYFKIFRLQRKGKHLSDFLTIHEYLAVHDFLDNKYYRPLLEDKILFDLYFKSFGVPTPEMLGIINRGKILWIEDKSQKELESILDRPLQAYCKRVTAFGGKGVYKIDVDSGNLSINNELASMDVLRSRLGMDKFILQRKVVQHDKMNVLNPSCVNTMRIYTIMDGEEPVNFVRVLRIGMNNNIVDNVSRNNLAVGIRENGYLMEEAHSGADPPVWYTEHPNSGVRFADFQVPFFEEAHEICRKGHQFFSEFFLIAWDVAITPDGPVIIEGNPAADLYGPQVFFGGLKKPFFKHATRYMRTQNSFTEKPSALIRKLQKEVI